MQALRDKIAQLAPTPETVLIPGESGTGKELVARAIHAVSDRATGPMVSLNCPVLSAQLMESELFGHERGAFTGAEAAADGTLRDGRRRHDPAGRGDRDRSESPGQAAPRAAGAVLRAGRLQQDDRSRRPRAGHDQPRPAREVAEGRFREDLYYRLAVVPLDVPPLRDRREDVPELIEHFLRRCAERLDREPAELDAGALDLLVRYHWPGNVRELENIVTRASVLHGETPLTADELRRWLLADPSDAGWPRQHDVPVGLSLQEMERKLIEATLEHFGGHRAKTAKALGIGVRTLSAKLRQYGYAPRERSRVYRSRVIKAGDQFTMRRPASESRSRNRHESARSAAQKRPIGIQPA